MNVKPTKLGYYIPGNGLGGPWRYLHSVLSGIDPAEFDVTLFCDLVDVYQPRPSVRIVRFGGAAVESGVDRKASCRGRAPSLASAARLAPRSVRVWAGFVREARRLARLLRRNRVDLFHTQNTGCEESPVAAKLAGIPQVLGTFHVGPTCDLRGERSGTAHRLLEVVSNRCLDAAVAVSRATKRDWVARTHVPADRVVTIHNGIDPDQVRRRQDRAAARRQLSLPVEGLIVGGLGRLDEAKGFAFLIDAAAELCAEFPDLTVALAGAGPLREGLKAQVERLGLSARIRFLGFQSNVQPVLDALDVFAFPSLSETLGYALLEAMATELPAVGSAVGGIPEVIVDGQTGFVVPARNPARLAAALRTLLKDTDLRARMGAAGRVRVEQCFHERTMVQKTLDLYRSIIAPHHGKWNGHSHVYANSRIQAS